MNLCDLKPGLRMRLPRTPLSVFGVAGFLFAGGAAFCGQQAGAKGGSKPTHEVHLKSDSTQRDEATKIASLTGHVKITSEDTTMLSDLASFNETTSVANSPGRIQIDDPQNTVIGSTGIAYYKRRDARISGQVHITVRPKPSNANAPAGSSRREFKDPIEITCDNVDYNWKTRVAVVTGHLTLKTNDRTVTADKGTYYGKDEMVVLDGHVHYTRPNGDHGDTNTATAVLTEGHETFKTNDMTAVITVTDEDEDNGAATTAPATPPATPTRPSNTVPPVVPPASGSTPPNSTTPGTGPRIPTIPPANSPTVGPPVNAPSTTGSGGTSGTGGTTP